MRAAQSSVMMCLELGEEGCQGAELRQKTREASNVNLAGLRVLGKLIMNSAEP